MKQRIISGVIAAVLVLVLLAFRTSIVFNIVVMLVGLVALNEALCATRMVKNIALFLVSALYTAFAAYFCYFANSGVWLFVTAAYLFVMLMLTIITHGRTKVTEIVYSAGMTLFIANSLASVTYIADISRLYPDTYKEIDGLLLLFASFVAWISDTGAYFVGSKFGVNKLCPNVSPKKTVEGLCGGVIASVIYMLVIGFIFNTWVFDGYKVSLGWLMLMGLIGSLVSVAGDLFFSCIKRDCGLKDFGNIMPGHGGILDRIDGTMFATVAVYLAFVLIYTITL